MKRATSLPGASLLLRSALFAYLFLLFLWLMLLGMCTFATAQSRTIYLSPTRDSRTKPMTVDDVIKLSKAGLSDDLIIQQIKKKGQRFDLSTDQLVQLKAAHVSDRVIQVMIDPTKDTVRPPAEKMTVQAAPIQPAKPSPEASRQDPPTSALPTEIGVYAKVNGKWSDVLPEVVNWKSGGAVKHVASVGIVKGDLNGHVNGAASKNRLTTPIEFLIVVPEGIAITEYQIIRLHQHGGDREFRTVTGGVFHVSGGATRDLMPFEGTKVAARTYTVNFSSSTGEYGFLPPGAFTSTNAASSGKIYSFRVSE